MKKILLLVLLLGMALYWLVKGYFPNVEINKYDSVDTVQEKGVMEKGWIPKILPLSAYEITESHDVENKNIFGKFKYQEQDEENFLSKLHKVGEMYEGEAFLFKIDKVNNQVDFRNKI